MVDIIWIIYIYMHLVHGNYNPSNITGGHHIVLSAGYSTLLDTGNIITTSPNKVTGSDRNCKGN